jgi:sugar/nucleoside kinase (ribokinase family)
VASTAATSSATRRTHFFSCSAYPLHSVFDPTGAGDSFLGGLVGWLAAHGKTKPTFEDLKSAVVHGSVVASYTCEAFSTHKLQTVTPLRRLAAYCRVAEAFYAQASRDR